MTLTDAIQQIRYRLGNRSNLVESRIVNELVLSQTRYEGAPFLPWFLMQFQQAMVTVAAQDYVTKLTGYLREHEERGGLWIYDTSGILYPLSKKPYANLKARQFDSAGARPNFYADGNGVFYLFNTPDAVYNMLCDGYFADTTIAVGMSGDTNLWLTNTPSQLIADVCARLASQLQMAPAVIQGFIAERSEAESQLLQQSVAMEEAWQDRNMGSIDAGNFNQ